MSVCCGLVACIEFISLRRRIKSYKSYAASAVQHFAAIVLGPDTYVTVSHASLRHITVTRSIDVNPTPTNPRHTHTHTPTPMHTELRCTGWGRDRSQRPSGEIEAVSISFIGWCVGCAERGPWGRTRRRGCVSSATVPRKHVTLVHISAGSAEQACASSRVCATCHCSASRWQG